MKIKIIISLLSFSMFYGQNKICFQNIMNDEQVLTENKIDDFIKYDFSNLLLKTDNKFVYGIIGDDYQRIRIKFVTIVKNEINPSEYLVYGKSNVKNNICEFIGKIVINKIQESKRIYFGVDNESKNIGIKTQGLLTAKYEFFENKAQKHSGVLKGEFLSKWFIDKNDMIKYDDINAHSDSYFNNSFVGFWKMYNSEKEILCNWADFRVPDVKCDFDIGVAEFNVSEKYLKQDWFDIILLHKINKVENESNKVKTRDWWK